MKNCPIGAQPIRCEGLVAVCTLVACLIAPGCGGPTGPAKTRPYTAEGNVAWVDPAGRRLAGWGGTVSFDVAVNGLTLFSGNGVLSFGDLVTRYRQGKKLYVKMVLYGDRRPEPAASVEVTEISGPFPITFHKHLYTVSGDQGLWSGIYHDKIAYVVPWTNFRQDADYTSFEDVKAALLTRHEELCMAGEGYDVAPYGIHTTTVGVWRAKDTVDRCEER